MMLFLLGKLSKTNEDRVIDVNIYWKRYPLHYIKLKLISLEVRSIVYGDLEVRDGCKG